MPIDYASMNQSLYEGKSGVIKELTEKALAEGISFKKILQDGLIAGMSVVGEDFKHNRIYVPEVLLAARAMKTGLAVLKPLMTVSGASQPRGTLVIGTVKGDLHDIGKNLVGMMAEGSGFAVFDLGVDQPAEKFVEAAKAHNADIVGMSALLTTTMGYMKTVIESLKEHGLNVKTCIGGAPISQTFADEIGADGYARDAAAAVELFKTLVPATESARA